MPIAATPLATDAARCRTCGTAPVSNTPIGRRFGLWRKCWVADLARRATDDAEQRARESAQIVQTPVRSPEAVAAPETARNAPAVPRRRGGGQPVELGERFGLLTVIAEAESNGKGRRVLCRCACGTEKVAAATSLRGGSPRSCGCARYARGDDEDAVPAIRFAPRCSEAGCAAPIYLRNLCSDHYADVVRAEVAAERVLIAA